MSKGNKPAKIKKDKPKPMSILWASEQPVRPSGYGVVTRELVKRLVQRGHEVNVMGWDYNGEDMKHEEGWTMVHAGIGAFGSELLNDASNAPTVTDMNLARLQPDIFFSLCEIYHTAHMVRSCNRMNVPHISYLPIDGIPFIYAWKDIIKMTHTPLWMSAFGRHQFMQFVNEYHTDGEGPDSKKDPFLDRFLSESIPMLYHGVDIDAFQPISDEEKAEMREQVGLEQWKTVFTSVGRNGNRKQQPRLLEAFAMMLSELEHPHEVGMILHTGDPTNSKNLGGWHLPHLVKDLGLENNVTFSDTDGNPVHGIPRNDVAKLYQIADCHVLATSGEGFGIPSAEAMACGIPIILPDNSTGPELVGEDRGLIAGLDTMISGPTFGVKLGVVSVRHLAQQMKYMVENPKERKEMGKNARRHAELAFNWEVLTDHLEELFRDSVGKPHPNGNNAVVKHHE